MKADRERGAEEFPLRIPVGRRLYELVEVPGPLIDGQGRRCLFRLDHLNGRIEIDESIPAAERGGVVGVAVAMAWRARTVPIRQPSAREWV